MNQTRTESSHRDRAHAEGHATCTCGQELDVCRHAHCPRCGHRLNLKKRLVAA